MKLLLMGIHFSHSNLKIINICCYEHFIFFILGYNYIIHDIVVHERQKIHKSKGLAHNDVIPLTQ